MLIVKDFKDYEIVGMSDGEKLEKWGKYYLLRPDPEIIWQDEIEKKLAYAHYHRSNKGGGYWEKLKTLPDYWTIDYKNLQFYVKLMGFKHTGVFPEQSINWDFMFYKISTADTNKKIKVLNLFAYTGCATVACLKAGAEVTHVDASKGMVDWAKENVKLNGLEAAPVRYIVDDCLKFVEREIRRGNKYDAIIMDPPSFGRGSNKEVWDIEKDLFKLVSLCTQLLVDKPIFFIINTYTTGLSKIVIENILKMTVGKEHKGIIVGYELGIEAKSGLILPCGVCGRYEG